MTRDLHLAKLEFRLGASATSTNHYPCSVFPSRGGSVEQAEQMLLLQMLLVIYGYDLGGHRCCSNTDGCSNKWMAVLQSRKLSALWDSALGYWESSVKGMPECNYLAQFQQAVGFFGVLGVLLPS
jgi:hypothetical protein